MGKLEYSFCSLSKFISPWASWPNLIEQHRKVAPEAFGPEGNLFNLINGKWQQPGHGKLFLSPVDATPLGRYPMIRLDAARAAVVAAEGISRLVENRSG